MSTGEDSVDGPWPKGGCAGKEAYARKRNSERSSSHRLVGRMSTTCTALMHLTERDALDRARCRVLIALGPAACVCASALRR
eukprot:6193241-Pleurochrysis_carterae.AAC.1